MRKEKNQKDSTGLKDRLDPELFQALQGKKQQLKQAEANKLEQQRQQQIKVRKRKEANKSFDELLEESELDWKKFK
ncbi:hypothetical protein GCM10011351_05260 [Paraliobacillus quinghaiensis]|uniref:DUF3886 domain-containing protein n=1 Tax=Paraliobacillus quinghaiensis TaxID=470815 RepID=A0A917WQY8_9BACI|nr:YqkE family protein [Paraliobacillus quinghaiensis]GGM22314.1 hypothetical protein GCM10011351_05260 [Paraliobacillus quinghaiensis]